MSTGVIERTLAIVSVAAAVAVSVPARPAVGQQTRADTAAVLLRVAEDLRAEGQNGLAQSILELILRRYSGTAAAETARQAAEGIGEERESTGGRNELVAWNTIYGAALGVMIPAALGADESAPYGVGLLIGTPLGFVASRAYANSRSMTPGHARAITFGTWWGTFQGIGWREVFDIGDETFTSCLPPPDQNICDTFDVDSELAPVTAAVIGGLVGLGTGAALGASLDISPSTALITNFAALWGTWYGVAGGVVANLENDGLVAATLIGGDIGLLTGALAGPSLNMSRRRAWLIHLTGIAGLVGGLGVDLIAQPNDEEVAILIPAIGSFVGLAAGFATTTKVDPIPSMGHGDIQSAFATVASGRLRFGLPMPIPALLPYDSPTKRRMVPGVKLKALDVSW